jgi:hypothetical protein
MLEGGFGQTKSDRIHPPACTFSFNLMMGCLRWYDDISITATGCEV